MSEWKPALGLLEDAASEFVEIVGWTKVVVVVHGVLWRINGKTARNSSFSKELPIKTIEELSLDLNHSESKKRRHIERHKVAD